MLSYWEKSVWLNNLDAVVIGSGLVGLLTAIHLKRRDPGLKILILERGVLPAGASTKNAGFACFGSLSEILDDASRLGTDRALELVERRYRGWLGLQQLLGNDRLGYEAVGGHELFTTNGTELYEQCLAGLDEINRSLHHVFGSSPFRRNDEVIRKNGFRNISHSISQPLEGQINTGKAMLNLLRMSQELGILMLNHSEVHEVNDTGSEVEVNTSLGLIRTQKVWVCTNGFARQLFEDLKVEPARAQVLITSEIPGLPLSGVFHLDRGYYYFRRVGNRVLLGGGRQLDFKGERTYVMETTPAMLQHLEQMLRTSIVPDQSFVIEDSWAGIMGLGPGNEKTTLLKDISPRIHVAVRLGGMGIALSTWLAGQAAERHFRDV